MTLVDAMTYAISNEGFEIVDQRRFVYYLNDLHAFDITPAARRVLTVIIDQGYGRKLIYLTQSSFLREVKINEIKNQIVRYEGFQADLVDEVVNSICLALHLIITEENKNVISLLVASLHHHAIRNISNIIGGLYNSSVIAEANLLQQIYIRRLLIERRIEAEKREREQAKLALGSLIGVLQFYAAQNIANIIGGLYNSSVLLETNILHQLYKNEVAEDYINSNEYEAELKRKCIADIIDALRLNVKYIEVATIEEPEITELQEVEETEIITETDMALPEVKEEIPMESLHTKNDSVEYIAEQSESSNETNVVLDTIIESKMDNSSLNTKMDESVNYERDKPKKKSLLRSLFSIFISD